MTAFIGINQDHTPTVVDDEMPAAQYHAIEAVSNSGITHLMRSPAHYKAWRDSPPEATPQMQWGTVLHAAVIEPETLDQVVAVEQKIDKRTREGKEAAAEFAAHAKGKIILDQEAFDRVLRTRDAIYAHPAAQILLDQVQRVETSMIWTDAQYNVMRKSRADFLLHNGGIVDLKSTNDASEEAFGRSIVNFNYVRQAVFYYDAVEACLNYTPSMYVLIAAERDPPYAVAVYSISPSDRDIEGIWSKSRAQIDLGLFRYAQALESGSWTAYSDLIIPAVLPRWATNIQTI